MRNLPKFKNKQLFEHAFIHRSYLNETKNTVESNERLEFLGDSILSFVISEHLFKTYPKFNEGILTIEAFYKFHKDKLSEEKINEIYHVEQSLLEKPQVNLENHVH